MSKEKTREIKVWLQPQSIEELEQDGFSYATVRNEPRRLYGKIEDIEATLLIKEPETEEKKAIRTILNSPFATGLTEQCRRELKEKLFGGKG